MDVKQNGDGGKIDSETPQQRSPNLVARLYAWACQRIYHEFAWGYDLVSWIVSCGRWSKWRRFAIEAATADEMGKNGPILELGFGTGELLVEWASRQRNDLTQTIYGLELSAPMQRVTAAKLAAHQLNVPRVQATAEEMPFTDGSFRTVLSTFPAAYIFSPQTLCECVRLLRASPTVSSATALAVEENENRLIIVGAWVSFNNPWFQLLDLPFYGEPDKSVVAEIVARMEHAGFRVELKTRRDGIFNVSVIEGVVNEGL